MSTIVSPRPYHGEAASTGSAAGTLRKVLLKRFRIYSIATIAVLLVSGTVTSLYGPRVAANQPTPGVGIFERIDLAGYLVWTAVLAIALLHTRGIEGRAEKGEVT